MFIIIEAYKAGLLQVSHWRSNILAGIIVGIVALPLAMAFAIASGVKPEQGLYTAIIAALLVGICGGSRTQIAGPTGAFIAILSGITAKYGINGLQMATMIAGVFLFLFGFFKFGSLVKYIPESVILGFTVGIGMIIFVGEWKDFLGLSVRIPLNDHFHQKILTLFTHIESFDLTTTLLGSATLALVMLTPRILTRIPGPLVAMVFATGLQAIFQFKSVATLGSVFGEIPHTLPSFQIPIIPEGVIYSLVEPALSIALLGAIESLLCASVADNLAGTKHDSNQELIGQGLANFIAPLFGGIASTGAIARTVTNIRNGGTGPLAAIIHSLVLVLVILFLAPLTSDIPLCALAAILFMVAFNMSDLPRVAVFTRRAPQREIFVLFVSCVLTILTTLVTAVAVGMLLSWSLNRIKAKRPSIAT